MARSAKWLALACVAILAAALVPLAGCGKGKEREIKAPKAQTHHCESCGVDFGVTFDREAVKKQVYPPFVCPKCGKRTAVRSILLMPKEGTEAVVYCYEKYSDEQIRQLEKIRNEIPEEQLVRGESPEGILNVEMGEAGGPMIKYPGSDRWLSPANPQDRQLFKPFDDRVKNYKSFMPIFPEGWPTYEWDDLKQR